MILYRLVLEFPIDLIALYTLLLHQRLRKLGKFPQFVAPGALILVLKARLAAKVNDVSTIVIVEAALPHVKYCQINYHGRSVSAKKNNQNKYHKFRLISTILTRAASISSFVGFLACRFPLHPILSNRLQATVA